MILDNRDMDMDMDTRFLESRDMDVNMIMDVDMVMDMNFSIKRGHGPSIQSLDEGFGVRD